MGYDTCVFCGNPITSSDRDHVYYSTCPNCGYYSITREVVDDFPGDYSHKYKDKLHLMSGYIREMNELGFGREIGTINSTNIEMLFKNSKVPKTLLGKLDKTLLYIYRKTDFPYKRIKIEISDKNTSIGYAKKAGELKHQFEALRDMGYIQIDGQYFDPMQYKCYLTIEGINRVEGLLKSTNEDSLQGFVAMWFDDKMLATFETCISKAISDAGFEPFIISMKDHNGNICDEIIAEIRKSRFLVADFTGASGGAYFEAGFALGLGLPVIWTCREDWFNNMEATKDIEAEIDGEKRMITIDDSRQIHFDVNHYNFIVWKTEEELYKKLKDRIEATVV